MMDFPLRVINSKVLNNVVKVYSQQGKTTRNRDSDEELFVNTALL